MKIILPGGSGNVGAVLSDALRASGHEVIVLSRKAGDGVLAWDGRTLGPWAEAIDGADVVINLAGRTVNCRYTPENLDQMMRSRVESTAILGAAIAAAARPPRVWLQMSTATIYAHRFDAPNDEKTGIIGGNEPDVPRYWDTSINIARAWEQTLADAPTPNTRKLALRAAMVMSPEEGGIFDTLLGLARSGLGGAAAGGRQYVSWIHHVDFVRAVALLIDREDVDGAVNLASPDPRPQREHMAALREAWGGWGAMVGLPATRWMLEIGAFFLRTDTELVLKSRRVVPGRLTGLGFEFRYPSWPEAAADLVDRWRQARR